MRRRKTLLRLAACLLVLPLAAGCGPEREGRDTDGVVGRMELSYAEQFSVDYLADGNALVTVGGGDRFLVVAGENEPPADPGAGVTVIRSPAERIYLASSSAGDLFLQLDALDALRATSTPASDWRIPELAEAVENEEILYAGKYSAPDFELLISEKCPLAVENTMIYHSPAIKEQLETLEIPVIVEMSSYESHPLGRVEWIKFYGVLFGLEEEADAFFRAQTAQLENIRPLAGENKTVAFFHINTVGAAVVRKPGDYVSKMIQMAGGTYVPAELVIEEENALSTMNLQMEAFYYGAKDADILIYNSTIDGRIDTIEQLLGKSNLLADFKAVQNGNVWCTEQSMFQQSSASAGMIMDLNAIITGTADSDTLTFLHRLK